ncbi:Na/Pi cotransporter family protein [Dendrosporobacter sp. 1207_IL3150]|uniref:Na/Pi cotransporter family protein n=1 Tax=Dendrosporobacter sp. 1207_IL3150 TaxID=3084054 RepID=UPI002FDB4B3E
MHTLTTLGVGISLLLFGIFFMRLGLQNMLGNKLRLMLVEITVTPWRGLIAGALASALMQSSTAVSLITIGLVSANYMTFYQSLGIILGANIGTCTTVQLMALSFPDQYFIPLLITFTVIAICIKKLRFICLAISGFISIFLGINILSDTLSSLSEIETAIQYILSSQSNPLYGIAGGILITMLFQSSSAATALLMILAGDGLINLTSAAYVVYGNNIGSCISSVIVGAAAPIAAKRVAAAHIILNIVGAALFLPFTNFLTNLIALHVTDFASQVALVHTLFNIISSIVVVPFAKQYAKAIIVLVPDR